MEAQVVVPIDYSFVLINEGQYKEVWHYAQVAFDSDSAILPYFANISKNRNFNNSRGVSFWYKTKDKNGKKFSDPVTGLKRTANPKVYFGDIPKIHQGKYTPKHLLIFHFSNDYRKLIIRVFVNFYPINENQFIGKYLRDLK